MIFQIRRETSFTSWFLLVGQWWYYSSVNVSHMLSVRIVVSEADMSSHHFWPLTVMFEPLYSQHNVQGSKVLLIRSVSMIAVTVLIGWTPYQKAHWYYMSQRKHCWKLKTTFIVCFYLFGFCFDQIWLGFFAILSFSSSEMKVSLWDSQIRNNNDALKWC